jgi:hypothetical protein
MSEKLFRFLLNELKTVRVRCGRCNVTLEVDTELLPKKFYRRTCPLCQSEYNIPHLPDDYNPFHDLAKLLRFFNEAKDQVTMEFTLPDKSGS